MSSFQRNGSYLTLREKIYLLLKESSRPLDVREIMARLNIPLQDRARVEESIEHLKTSIKRKTAGREKLEVVPPKCVNCGYVFRGRDSSKKPSRCPNCRSQRIRGPWFYLKYG
uniref:Transcriptional regulator n=1 Tax=Fervidicoccus fontis TaxID=683846 RepID=A0A7J3ZIW2_9CREN